MPRTGFPFTRLLAPLGVLLGTVVGAALVSLAGATASRSVPTAVLEHGSTLEVTHLPPLLTAGTGEGLELGFDAYCLPAGVEDPEAPCRAAGSVFVRPGDRGAFRELPLVLDGTRAEGRFVARVPADLARSPLGISYYARIEDRETGATVTLPAGGADAPQRSLPLGEAVEIDLGRHAFGSRRFQGTRVADAAWGSGRHDVGLEEGRNLSPIGGSSFDVAKDGAVYVLDQSNRRALRWRRGDAEPASIPLAIDGTIADLAVDDGGALYVLETSGHGEPSGLLRAFTAEGRATATTTLAERAYRVRIGPDGMPFVLEQTSSQWVQALRRDGRPAPVPEQRSSGRPGRPLADGGEVVVLREGNEVRIAVLGPGGARRTWRVRSDTPLAEVQLAEPVGRRVVAVVRAYSDSRDEFVVLVLGPHGLESSFAVPSADWAETAPLSRFRLIGSSLYQLGSTPAGLFVDRYDLEVE